MRGIPDDGTGALTWEPWQSWLELNPFTAVGWLQPGFPSVREEAKIRKPCCAILVNSSAGFLQDGACTVVHLGGAEMHFAGMSFVRA